VSDGSHSTELALFEFGSIEKPNLLTRSYFVTHTINITNKLPNHRRQAVQPEMTDYKHHHGTLIWPRLILIFLVNVWSGVCMWLNFVVTRNNATFEVPALALLVI
jgi:hypothetical protein